MRTNEKNDHDNTVAGGEARLYSLTDSCFRSQDIIQKINLTGQTKEPKLVSHIAVVNEMIDSDVIRAVKSRRSGWSLDSNFQGAKQKRPSQHCRKGM